MKYSTSSRNSKPWSKITPRGRSILYSQIMVDNSPRTNSKKFLDSMVLRGILSLHTFLKKMGFRNERKKPLWE